MTRLTVILTLALSLISGAAWACAWPDNWLGPADPTYRVLNIGVFYHAAVLHDLPDEAGVTPLPGGDPTSWLAELAARPELNAAGMAEELARIRPQLDDAARFYWRNSRFNCALRYDWIVDFTPRLRSAIAANDPPYNGPVDAPFYGDARERYDGLIQIMVLYVYDQDTGGLKRVKGGGGWTWGAEAKTHQCGWSWWAATTADSGAGNDWLLVHEFGHQLDSLFHESGHPEVWFNHLAAPEGNLARYGEHFDCNSYILRRIPEADWLDLKWGGPAIYADADGDLVPDPDQELLALVATGLDLDPDPSAPDSDGDGLDDFAEHMASNGNRNGHSERLYPALKPCDPLDRDSDCDGIPDGADALPMCPLAAYIPMAGLYPWDTEELQPEEIPAPVFNEMSLGFTGSPDGLDFAFGLSYEYEKDLVLFVKWPTPTHAAEQYEFQLMLDLDNDGWFKGSDNYKLLLGEEGLKRIVRTDGSSATEGPRNDDQAVDLALVGIEPLSDSGGLYQRGYKLTLTRELFPELAAKPGEVIGLNLGIRHAGTPWYYTIGEPNALIPLELR